MNVKHSCLRAFHAVAANGSFSRAAQALHVTQPTLSGQVKELEQRFDVQLLERHSRGTDLTDLGRALFEQTRRLFETETEIEQLLSAAHGLVSGELRVGADAPYHVLPLLASFSRHYPGIHLSLAFGNSRQLLSALLDGQYDIAVLPNVRSTSRLHAIQLQPDRLVVLVSREHAWISRRSVTLKELAGQRLILREPGSTTRAILEQAAFDAGIRLSDVMEIGSREGVREAVAAGLGVGVISETERGHDSRLHFLSVRDAKLQNTEYICCQSQNRDKAAISAFLELIPSAALG